MIETDGDAMLNAIRENPYDNAPRLIYADWLEEQGENERAAFIRLPTRYNWYRYGYGDWRWKFLGPPDGSKDVDGYYLPKKYIKMAERLICNQATRRYLRAITFRHGFIEGLDIDELYIPVMSIFGNQPVQRITLSIYKFLDHRDFLAQTSVREVHTDNIPNWVTINRMNASQFRIRVDPEVDFVGTIPPQEKAYLPQGDLWHQTHANLIGYWTAVALQCEYPHIKFTLNGHTP